MEANGKPEAADHLPGLLPHHLKRLRASGLSDATITAAGIKSETSPHTLAAMLNCARPQKSLAPAILIPFADADGRNGYCRVRPDTPRKQNGKPVKYESPRGQPNQIYLPAGVEKTLDDSSVELCITEGEFKALAGTQFGFPTIGLIGVYGWKEKRRERMVAQLERIAWRGRPVRIVFDSDLERKPEVQSAEARLAKHLADRGAIVRCVRLPDGPPGDDGQPTKLGLDDYLVAHGPAELRKLLDAAGEPEKVEGPDGKEDAGKIDPGDEAKAYLKTLEHDGQRRLRFWRSGWWLWNRGAYHEREQAEARAAMIQYLDASYRSLGSGVVSCVLDHLKAHSILPTDTEPGTWLENGPDGWRPDEILATRKELIHLPTLITSGADPVRPATPKLFVTAALNFDFDLRPPRPDTWLTFLSQLWPDDAQAIDTLAEWFGYLLTPNTRQQKILLLVGPRRSGKGITARVARELVGRENAAGPTLASLATNFGLQPLLGKSVAIISDARLSGKTDRAIVIERLLSISGEDALTVDGKFRDHVTCKLPTRLMILTNELPRLLDASGALASRFVVLRLSKSFYGHEDQSLFDKLVPELPGILLWAIAGWQRLRERGHFLQPDSGRELAGDMEDLNSPIGAFIRERCVIAPQCEIAVDELFAAWRKWCEGNGWKEKDAGTVQVFGRDLSAAVSTVRTRQVRRDEGDRHRVFTGIELAN